jgi:hypothetical protein
MTLRTQGRFNSSPLRRAPSSVADWFRLVRLGPPRPPTPETRWSRLGNKVHPPTLPLLLGPTGELAEVVKRLLPLYRAVWEGGTSVKKQIVF